MSTQPARVLILVSSADRIPLREGGTHPTGVFLGELTEPVDAMRQAGFALTFASPGGRPPTIDANAYNLMYWGFSKKRLQRATEIHAELLEQGLDRPEPLEQIAHEAAALRRFDALFIPGGHAPMVDLLHANFLKSDAPNPHVAAVLEFFHGTSRPTGLICHAPAVLATAPRPTGKWIYDGYSMTCVTMLSECLLEDFPLTRVVDGHLKEYPSVVLRNAGAILDQSRVPMLPKVVDDRELMTGQDPYAAPLFAEQFVEKIRAHHSGAQSSGES